MQIFIQLVYKIRTILVTDWMTHIAFIFFLSDFSSQWSVTFPNFVACRLTYIIFF